MKGRIKAARVLPRLDFQPTADSPIFIPLSFKLESEYAIAISRAASTFLGTTFLRYLRYVILTISRGFLSSTGFIAYDRDKNASSSTRSSRWLQCRQADIIDSPMADHFDQQTEHPR